MKLQAGLTFCTLAGLAVGMLAPVAHAQSITPPDVYALSQSWYFAPSYEQQLSGSFEVTRFRLVATGGQCNTLSGGGAWHNDMLMELVSPTGVTLLIGGDFGTPYPGSFRWNDPIFSPQGTLPASSASPMQIDVTLSHNFGPVEGVWRVNFQNHWSSGDVPWSNIQITPCAPGVCPEPGACCMPAGSCSVIMPETCSAQGGVFQGPGTACGNCPPPVGVFEEIGDAGEVPLTAMIATNATGSNDPLNAIIGNGGGMDVDMFMIEVCDAANFSATTVGGAEWDTILAIFNEQGYGVAYNDDAVGATVLQSTITSQFVQQYGNGVYYIAVSQYPRHPLSTGGRIWEGSPFRAERSPDGIGGFEPIIGWDGSVTGAGGPYTIAFTGACFVGSGNLCYANCDSSTTAPILNVDDFTCFINEFAQAQGLPHEQQITHYANCDHSTTAPVLNVDDFTCFINAFAQGCP